MTLFPAHGARTSKVHKKDDTVIIGGLPERRRLLEPICAALHVARRQTDQLIDLEPQTVVSLFHASRKAAGLPAACMHELRHGGASHDGLAGVEDAEMLGRGRWASVKSLRRYRSPAAYIRRLQLLSPTQRAKAAAAPATILQLLPGLLRRLN